MLAAHMDIEKSLHRDQVRRFWGAPSVASKPGLKAVDMFRAVADGRIKALWIMATNPVVSMPDADTVEAAIKACPFVVVSDIVRDTDTARHAHVLLPSLGWGEKDGTVTNSERRISRQRPFLAAPAKRGPTGGNSPKSEGAWASPRPSPMVHQPRSSPSMPRFRGSKTKDAAISTSAPMRRSTAPPMTD